MITGACATAPRGPHSEAGVDLVWPPPPEAARVRFVQSVSGPADLLGPSSLVGQLRDVIFGTSTVRLVNPSALAVDEQVGLVVADTGLPGIHVFDWQRGRYSLLTGDEDHPVFSPVGVAIAPDGTLWVSDSVRSAVTHLSFEGEVLGEIFDPANLHRPAGIAYDETDDTLVIVDVLAHCVRRFTTGGELIATVGEQGAEPGKFNFPTHLALDAEGNMAVTDSLNFRVQLLSRDGTPQEVIGRLGDAPGCLARPKGVAFDVEGNIWIVDAQFENIQAFDREGRLLLHIGDPGHRPGEFWLPSGLAIDAGGRLFVADTHNGRAQIFQLVTAQEATP